MSNLVDVYEDEFDRNDSPDASSYASSLKERNGISSIADSEEQGETYMYMFLTPPYYPGTEFVILMENENNYVDRDLDGGVDDDWNVDRCFNDAYLWDNLLVTEGDETEGSLGNLSNDL